MPLGGARPVDGGGIVTLADCRDTGGMDDIEDRVAETETSEEGLIRFTVEPVWL